MLCSGVAKCVYAMVMLFILTVACQDIAAAPCPCDIYAAGGTPCVAAHSTVRALFSTYNGPLYQVIRLDNAKTMDILPVAAGGLANTAARDSFVNGTTGKVKILYDQSGHNNNLTKAPPGTASNITDSMSSDTAKVIVNGKQVYGLYMHIHDGYRNNATTAMATGNKSEGMYWVVDGKRYNGGCCWDYGNAETNNAAGGTGLMHCLFFGNITVWGSGTGSGPWIMADLEAGVFSGGTTLIKNNPACPSLNFKYVSATLKNSSTTYSLKYGNAQSGPLTTIWDGACPSPWHLQGAIILGIGGDNSNGVYGTFFEGAIASGRPLDTTEDAIQKNIVDAYGTSTQTSRPGANDAAPASLFKVSYNQSSSIAVVTYTLQDAGHVNMTVFDQRGRQIAAIVDGVLPAGPHEAVWDARRVPAGVYICRTAIGGLEKKTGKIIVGK